MGALIMIACTIMASTAESLGTFLVYGALMVGMLGWLWGIGYTYLSEFFRTSLRGTGFRDHGRRWPGRFDPRAVAGGWGIAEYGLTGPFLATSGLWVLTIIGYLMGPRRQDESSKKFSCSRRRFFQRKLRAARAIASLA